MALIGFRSPLTYHPWPWSEYTEEQKKMFNVRPGITGWAQVNGRKTVEWNKRIELNGWYQENNGLGGAINAGLQFVTGEYLCWPDADDYLEPTAVEDRVKAFLEHPDCAVVTSNAYVKY